MTADVRQDKPALSEPWICPKCTGVRGAHYLTCPTLRLGAASEDLAPEDGSGVSPG